MKRYFTFQKAPTQNYRPRGLVFWMGLPSGGHVGLLTEESVAPLADWKPLPSLLSRLPAGLSDYDCTPIDTMYKAAVKLGKANRYFHP